MSDQLEQEKPRKEWLKIMLSFMLVFYGMTTAGSAYQVRVFTGKATRSNNVGLIELVRANDLYSQADQIANLDRELITELWLGEARGDGQDVFDILYDNMSLEAVDSIERSGDLDDQYYNEIYATADSVYNNAFSAFQTSKDIATIKNEYDLIVLLLAMGAAFSAWASFIEKNNLIRYVFAIISLLIIIGAVWLGWGGCVDNFYPP